jgi:hypothetical protein
MYDPIKRDEPKVQPLKVSHLASPDSSEPPPLKLKED